MDGHTKSRKNSIKPLSEDRKKEAEKVYRENKLLIYSIAQKFYSKHGGDIDELESICHLSFIKAFSDFERHYSRFSSWFSFVAWNDMMDDVRKKAKKLKPRRVDRNPLSTTKPLFDIIDSLDGDACDIVDLVIHTPSDLQELIVSSGGDIKRVKDSIFCYLKKLGWKADRINQGFRQIRFVLRIA